MRFSTDFAFANGEKFNKEILTDNYDEINEPIKL